MRRVTGRGGRWVMRTRNARRALQMQRTGGLEGGSRGPGVLRSPLNLTIGQKSQDPDKNPAVEYDPTPLTRPITPIGTGSRRGESASDGVANGTQGPEVGKRGVMLRECATRHGSPRGTISGPSGSRDHEAWYMLF